MNEVPPSNLNRDGNRNLNRTQRGQPLVDNKLSTEKQQAVGQWTQESVAKNDQSRRNEREVKYLVEAHKEYREICTERMKGEESDSSGIEACFRVVNEDGDLELVFNGNDFSWLEHVKKNLEPLNLKPESTRISSDFRAPTEDGSIVGDLQIPGDLYNMEMGTSETPNRIRNTYGPWISAWYRWRTEWKDLKHKNDPPGSNPESPWVVARMQNMQSQPSERRTETGVGKGNKEEKEKADERPSENNDLLEDLVGPVAKKEGHIQLSENEDLLKKEMM